MACMRFALAYNIGELGSTDPDAAKKTKTAFDAKNLVSSAESRTGKALPKIGFSTVSLGASLKITIHAHNNSCSWFAW